MTYLQIISAILFLISIGSGVFHKTKNADISGDSAGGTLLTSVLFLISFILLSILISDIGNLKWYWSILIAIASSIILSGIFADFYSSIFGFKSKPTLSLAAGAYVKHNLHIIDAIITFIIGLILFFITLFMN